MEGEIAGHGERVSRPPWRSFSEKGFLSASLRQIVKTRAKPRGPLQLFSSEMFRLLR